MKEFEFFKWVLIGQDNNSVEQSVVEDKVDCWGSDQETSEGEEKQWPRDHWNILTKNMAALLCPKNQPKAKFKTSGLMALAKEI